MGYHTRVIFDGNMKELWDFNRSSVKSYLFFLIYLSTHLVCFENPRNKSIREGNAKNLFFCRLEIKNGHFRAFYCEWLGERRD